MASPNNKLFVFVCLLFLSVSGQQLFECSQKGLMSALKSGGDVAFECSENVDILISSALNFEKSVSLDGRGLLTLRSLEGDFLFGTTAANIEVHFKRINIKAENVKESVFSFTEKEVAVSFIQCSVLTGSQSLFPSSSNLVSRGYIPGLGVVGSSKCTVHPRADSPDCLYPPSKFYEYDCFSLTDLFTNAVAGADVTITVSNCREGSLAPCVRNYDENAWFLYEDEDNGAESYCFARQNVTKDHSRKYEIKYVENGCSSQYYPTATIVVPSKPSMAYRPTNCDSDSDVYAQCSTDSDCSNLYAEDTENSYYCRSDKTCTIGAAPPQAECNFNSDCDSLHAGETDKYYYCDELQKCVLGCSVTGPSNTDEDDHTCCRVDSDCDGLPTWSPAYCSDSRCVNDGCFLATSQVLMADGTLQTASLIKSGDWVQGLDGPAKVLIAAERPLGSNRITNINGRGGVFTQDHPLAASASDVGLYSVQDVKAVFREITDVIKKFHLADEQAVLAHMLANMHQLKVGGTIGRYDASSGSFIAEPVTSIGYVAYPPETSVVDLFVLDRSGHMRYVVEGTLNGYYREVAIIENHIQYIIADAVSDNTTARLSKYNTAKSANVSSSTFNLAIGLLMQSSLDSFINVTYPTRPSFSVDHSATSLEWIPFIFNSTTVVSKENKNSPWMFGNADIGFLAYTPFADGIQYLDQTFIPQLKNTISALTDAQITYAVQIINQYGGTQQTMRALKRML